MIAMGKAMGLTVMAEGIETEQQLDYLQNQNVISRKVIVFQTSSAARCYPISEIISTHPRKIHLK